MHIAPTHRDMFREVFGMSSADAWEMLQDRLSRIEGQNGKLADDIKAIGERVATDAARRDAIISTLKTLCAFLGLSTVGGWMVLLQFLRLLPHP
jgi:hypothetical protein